MAKNRKTPDNYELANRWNKQNALTAWGLGGYKRFNRGIWEAVDDDVIRQETMKVIVDARSQKVRPTKALLTSVLELARVDISVNPKLWDANQDVVVCNNGTLHIPTRRLLPHDPLLYATSRLEFDYDPAAQAPNFISVMKRLPPEKAEFVQEFAGYCLTTDVRHEISVWFYGPIGSGKSTILLGLQAMLSSRCGILGVTDIQRSRFGLSNLPGKTLVISTEQPDGIMATDIINKIISGEPITIDRKFVTPYEITPYAKVAWALNKFPMITDTNNGIMRRVKIVEFPVLPDAKQNPDVKERVKTEGAGILNWALDGLDRLRNRGNFNIPDCVKDDTKEFIKNSDIPALFLEDVNAEIGPQYKSGGEQLFEAFDKWCRKTNHKSMSSTKLAVEWVRLGFVRKRDNGHSYWHGVGL